MFKIVKIYAKHQKYLKYLLILYPNTQTIPIYMLSLDDICYSNLYIIYYFFIDFEKFKVYNKF